MQMLCWNRVADFDAWWQAFETNGEAGRVFGVEDGRCRFLTEELRIGG